MDKQELRAAKDLSTSLRALDIISDMDSYIHNDWSDIKALLNGNDLAWISVARADGEDGVVEAAKHAMATFSDETMKMMDAICISVVCLSHETLQKVTCAVDEVRACVQPDAAIIWGMSFDDQIDSGGEVTVIGFGRCPDNDRFCKMPIAQRKS